MPERRELESSSTSQGLNPILGVALMVGISMILAGVIGTFIISLGENVQGVPPNPDISVSATHPTEETAKIRFQHYGVAAVSANNLDIRLPPGTTEISREETGLADGWYNNGDSITVVVETPTVSDLATVDLVWAPESDSMDTTSIARFMFFPES